MKFHSEDAHDMWVVLEVGKLTNENFKWHKFFQLQESPHKPKFIDIVMVIWEWETYSIIGKRKQLCHRYSGNYLHHLSERFTDFKCCPQIEERVEDSNYSFITLKNGLRRMQQNLSLADRPESFDQEQKER